MNYPGVPGRGLGGGASSTAGMSEQEQMIVKGVSRILLQLANISLIGSLLQMTAAMESCAGKTVVSGGMGFVLGGMIGLFMSSVCCVLRVLFIYELLT